ncbi:Helix-turn-helix [Candidatus Thermokryptus mobilis]|uniref:Helix-turn-helix n=1 Tax=Candidatus Thermokryptus mobilis TaxID=1643428 RepID=A0A0S4NEW0_9BACT|nr:Helix-turn-helix [Candidatus Thermokryptus mobilis]
MLGISKEYYCKIENDKVFPSKELLLKIIKMTGIEFKLNARIKNPSSYLTNQAN